MFVLYVKPEVPDEPFPFEEKIVGPFPTEQAAQEYGLVRHGSRSWRVLALSTPGAEDAP